MSGDEFLFDATGVVYNNGAVIFYKDAIISMILAPGTWVAVLLEDE